MDRFKIYVGSVKVSLEVQKVLFSRGYRWNGGDTTPELRGNWLFLDPKDNTITGSTGYSYGRAKDVPEIFLDSIFHDTSKWEPKAKELTVAEISAKLGYTVKVVE